VTSKLLLSAATAAAALASVAPAVTHGSTAAANGLVVAAADRSATLVAPQRASVLRGAASGSPALAARTRLTIVRTTDGATLFTGSLATFHALPVRAGASLRVQVQRPAGYTGLQASAMLRWS
jgi:hypothetical protein